MRRLGWLAVIGGAVVLAVLATWFALDLLLGEANQADAAGRPVARIDAIRTGLTVAAGAGALFALGLALRRQWYTEHDSRERRITELYVQSVEQLGSERAPVRLGGLYALARLGQDNPSHRQTVMDVLCGYLRMPFDEEKATDELQVRQTAQRLLAKHLQYSEPAFWSDIDLDLSGATLVGFNLYRCRARIGNFNRATFTGRPANFRGAMFTEGAGFFDAKFDTAIRLDDPPRFRIEGELSPVDRDGVEGVGE